jgi:hypothetical protein
MFVNFSKSSANEKAAMGRVAASLLPELGDKAATEVVRHNHGNLDWRWPPALYLCARGVRLELLTDG